MRAAPRRHSAADVGAAEFVIARGSKATNLLRGEGLFILRKIATEPQRHGGFDKNKEEGVLMES